MIVVVVIDVVAFCVSRWSRREEADFYRVVSTFGVERDPKSGELQWENFRNIAHLDRKYDDTLSEYFRAFYHMCLSVCRRIPNDGSGKECLSGFHILCYQIKDHFVRRNNFC